MNNKPITGLSEDELLNLLDTDSSASQEDEELNNLLTKFIHEYQIEDGKEEVHCKYLHILFKRFSKLNIGIERFNTILSQIFKFKRFDTGGGGVYLLNKDQLKFTDLIVDYLVTNNRKVYSPDTVKRHLQLFISTYKAKPANIESHPEYLYMAYKKCLLNNQYAKMTVLTFQAFCDGLSVFFDRSSEGNFLVAGRFQTFMTSKELTLLERKIKGDQKKTQIE